MFWRLLLAIVLLVVVVGGIVGFNLFRDRMIAGFFAGMQPPPVDGLGDRGRADHLDARASRRSAPRSARAASTSAVEAGGIVQEILFRANDRVEAGQQLVQIDDAIERADLAAAQAALDLAARQLARAESAARARRHAGLRARRRPGRRDQRRRAQVVRLTAVMEQKALEAPFDGIIGIPQVEVGEYVRAGHGLRDAAGPRHACASTSRSPSSRSG